MTRTEIICVLSVLCILGAIFYSVGSFCTNKPTATAPAQR